MRRQPVQPFPASVALAFLAAALGGCAEPPPEAPPWDFSLPPMPERPAGPVNVWLRGEDLGAEWNVDRGVGAGKFQVLWLIIDIDSRPRPGSQCGLALGTRADFDVSHRAVRALDRSWLHEGEEALLSWSTDSRATSCSTKAHLWLPEKSSGETPVEVAANGSALIRSAGLWLGPGQTAGQERNETADGVHTWGTYRLLHLGAWDEARVWVDEEARCEDLEPPSLNCLGRGSGP